MDNNILNLDANTENSVKTSNNSEPIKIKKMVEDEVIDDIAKGFLLSTPSIDELRYLKSLDKDKMYLYSAALLKALIFKHDEVKGMENHLKLDNHYCIDRYSYLIHDELESLLRNGHAINRKRPREKNIKGVYIVVLKQLNNNTFIYKYLYYPHIFINCLLYYFENIHSCYCNSYIHNLFIMSDFNGNLKFRNCDLNIRSFYHTEKTNLELYIDLVYNYKIPLVLDIDNICKLTHDTINKDLYNVILQILKPST